MVTVIMSYLASLIKIGVRELHLKFTNLKKLKGIWIPQLIKFKKNIETN